MTSEERPARPRIYTTKRCGDCLTTKTVLDRLGVDYDEIDIDGDAESPAMVLAINGGYRTVPAVVLPDGRVLIEPTPKALLSEFGPAS